MFATRLNQENEVYLHQRAAASKPLNQGLKGLPPKTPGKKDAKTPFRAPLRDENEVQKTGRNGKLSAESFVTPAGPRNRAPLGNKTTNAKATAFRTPAPVSKSKPSVTKHTSPRIQKARIQVHQSEPEIVVQNDPAEEPEVEYAPPREVPLPDYPDDWPHDRVYPQFEGKNFTRGWWSEFRPAPDSDQDSLGDPEEFQQEMKRLKEKERGEDDRHKVTISRADEVKLVQSMSTAKGPSTLRSRSAASALSSSSTHGRAPSFAAPTASAKARNYQPTLAMGKPRSTTLLGNPRHTAAKVASNSALGYGKGRLVSRTRKASQDKDASSGSVVVKAPSAPPPALEQIFGPSFELSEVSGQDDVWDNPAISSLEEEFEHFQLDAT